MRPQSCSGGNNREQRNWVNLEMRLGNMPLAGSGRALEAAGANAGGLRWVWGDLEVRKVGFG